MIAMLNTFQYSVRSNSPTHQPATTTKIDSNCPPAANGAAINGFLDQGSLPYNDSGTSSRCNFSFGPPVSPRPHAKKMVLK